MSFKARSRWLPAAGPGIGSAAALAFAREAAKVVVSDVSPSDGQKTAKQIEEAGGEAAFVNGGALRVDGAYLAR